MFGPEVDAAAKRHALDEWPKECCGIVVNSEYRRLKNVSPTPEDNFAMTARTWTRRDIQAVIHSHDCSLVTGPRGNRIPRHPHCPSAADMRGQVDTDVPWGIVSCNGSDTTDLLWWGDFRLHEPLLERRFIPGIHDCYGLIRGWYAQERGIVLKEFPRDAEWWDDGGDLFRQGFTEADFVQIGPDDAQAGDVVLMRLHSPVPCHGGVVLDNGLLLHHLENRLSRREPLGRWRKFITHWLRYAP